MPTLCIAILLADAIKSTSDGATPSDDELDLLHWVLVIFCWGGWRLAPDNASKYGSMPGWGGSGSKEEPKAREIAGQCHCRDCAGVEGTGTHTQEIQVAARAVGTGAQLRLTGTSDGQRALLKQRGVHLLTISKRYQQPVDILGVGVHAAGCNGYA